MADKERLGFAEPDFAGADGVGKRSKWARDVLDKQRDGLWGNFHTLSMQKEGGEIATEQALRRLRYLGFTAQDTPVARTLDRLRGVLRGTDAVPDRREVTHDWALFTELMFAAWLRLFIPDDPDGCRVAARWAAVLDGAFASGMYDGGAYRAAYLDVFGKPPAGARFLGFTNFYVVTLVANRLGDETEARVFDYLLGHPEGIYYLYYAPMNALPEVFASRETAKYLYGLEALARYESDACRGKLRFAADWLRANAQDDTWDLGPQAKDGVALPLSDDWRRRERRVADCTHRVGTILRAIEGNG